MQFNQSIPLLSRPKYAEGTKLSSSRDDRNNSLQWKKGDANMGQIDSVNQAIQKLSREVAKGRRRIVGGFVAPPDLVDMFPFRIYNIENVTADAAQKLIYSSLNLNINDYNYQIRGGLIGARSRYVIGVPSGWLPEPMGNFEQQFFIPGTDFIGDITGQSSNNKTWLSQPSPNLGICAVLDNSADVLICDNGADPEVVFDQVIIDPTPDYYGDSLASFYVKLVDDPTNGIQPQLWGRMFTYDPFSLLRPNGEFPAGTNIVPLGIVGRHVSNSADINPTCNLWKQCQWGNCINRFVGNQSNNLGKWTADALSGQVFYNGDIVIDDTILITIGTTTFYDIWQYNAGSNVENTEPHSNASNWKLVGTFNHS